jgi:hypothetical protein
VTLQEFRELAGIDAPGASADALHRTRTGSFID